MKYFLLFSVFFVICGCKRNSVSEKELSYLNGYWEITEVEFPDGAKKNYAMSSTIDFIHIEDNQGFRKKMQPKFNDSYTTSNNRESFKVIEINDTFILSYKNNLSEWEEKLVQLDSMSFLVRNEAGVLYTYKRFQPIKIPK